MQAADDARATSPSTFDMLRSYSGVECESMVEDVRKVESFKTEFYNLLSFKFR